MGQLTIYLDALDGRRSKWFWTCQTAAGAIWIFQGIVGVQSPPSRLPFWPWVNVFIGFAWLGAVAAYFLVQRLYGRMRIVLSDSGLAVKARELGSAEEIAWQDVERMHFRLNHVDIVRKDGAGSPIPVRLGSYALNQRVKEALEKSTTEHGLEIVREDRR